MNPSHDRVERIAQLVRYGREKFLFHPARCFGFLQRLMFRIDVSARDDPSDDTFRFVELRNATHQEPSVLTVGMPPQTSLNLDRMAVSGSEFPFRFERG